MLIEKQGRGKAPRVPQAANRYRGRWEGSFIPLQKAREGGGVAGGVKESSVEKRK